MNVALGGVIGAVLGALAWRGAACFVARCEAERAVGGWASPPAALTLAGMALWGAFVNWCGVSLAQTVSALVVAALLMTITLVDLQVRSIPNALVLALLIWALVQMFVFGRPTPVAAGLGVLAGGGVLFVMAVAGRGAMGAGDVKLAAALGAVLGWPAVLPALLYGIIAGGVAALLLLLLRRADRKSAFAYGPYLALGAVIVLAQQITS